MTLTATRHPAVSPVFSRASAAGANLSHTIRRFDRFELKYIVSLREVERFKDALDACVVRDHHGDSDGSSGLASLCYDSR